MSIAQPPSPGPFAEGALLGFLGTIGMEIGVEGGRSTGHIPVAPWLCGPGGGIRLGIAAILADLVIGIPPTGSTASTSERALRWLAPPPESGTVTATGKVLKWGRRLMYGECSITDDRGQVVGWAAGTFITGELGGGDAPDRQGIRRSGVAPEPHASVEEALQTEVVGPGTVELPLHPRVINGPGGTVQGGIQAVLAELAAERALPGEHVVTELALRYLRRAKVGPVHGKAEALPGAVGSERSERSVRVELVDTGNDSVLTHVLGRIRPLR
jgi:acyl-coenzyme A thioesterase PaaI-like protein